MLHQTSTKPDLFMKNSCTDLQSRLKIRKILGVGDTAGSKVSQILGHSDHLVFQLPPKLAAWLLLTTTLFSCFTVMGLLWPSCLQFILPGGFESTLHLGTSYAFLATMLGLTLRSGDKTSLRLVLFSLALFHGLSFFISIWFLKTSDTKIKSMASLILHFGCLLINAHFYRSIIRSASSFRSHTKLKSYFHSILSFSSSIDNNTGHDSS
ncbi:unnamed protein product [Adineta steineri]|uniref:Tumor protein p53-inducible protein 11 n=1 Tax=Adineta steineri TaxID=433720 RepID=A0A815N419_9BILA|nr:unnamed protein product [Adineta steineri]CAF1428174.1 unnamed protein product [Adineta steineri]CAF1429316.1 unnamed protein product [Adineta steineri]